MTKTYNDIEAVTRLLEEKEKDLELTARIGKELLTQNQKLEANIASLQAELKTANEKLTQLSHELIKKTELIQVLTNDVDDSGSEAGTPSGLRCINLEFMQRRIGSLEEENKQLRNEATQLARDTTECEEAEQRLVQDIAMQLANANMEVDGMASELERHKEESRLQHEEIVSLSSKLAIAEEQLQRFTIENEELANMLHVTRDNQNKLASELADFKDRYAEVMSLLQDAQEQLRRQRRKGMPTARGGSLFPSLNATALPDSIANELESSLVSELSLDSGISADRTPAYKKVFETVRCASRNSASSTTSNSPVHQLYPPRGGSGIVPPTGPPAMLTCSSSSGPRMSSFVSPHMGAPSRVGPALSFPSLDSVGQSESDSSMITDSEDNYPGGQRPGVPGVPGAADLEAALRRLTPAEVIARRAMLSSGSFMGYDYTDGGGLTPPSFLPYGCRTPDSIMSTGSSGLSGYSGNSGSWKLPEKLQIVKPLEGSLTLAAWSQLATPTLGGLLEERPGVKIRGGRPLEDLGLEMYTLSDLEEDEECEYPGKRFQDTGSIYTYTNSTVLHPDDNTTVTSSVHGSQMCTVAPSVQNTAPPTPAIRSRRNSTSTFSTTLGLAKLLNERGIKAITPSAVATPCGERSFSPTATPCNSPDGSPPLSRSSSPTAVYTPLKLGFLSTGADLLRRTFSGEADRKSRSTKRSKMTLSRSERKALTGIRIVEKLERIGLETIMSTTASSSISPLTLQGALYSRRTLKSPMAQLTSLKNTISSTGVSPSPSSGLPPTPKKSSSTPITTPREFGVPGRPGSGALNQLPSHQRRPNGVVRPDLGTVSSSVPPKNGPRTDLGAPPVLGTVSSVLFGRKGGLL
ncbi:trafficking kinesin-binding protein milt isoform X3 [Anabrus simplex]